MCATAKRVPETISDAEESIQRSLEAIRGVPFSDDLRVGLNYFLRPGYRPIVQLEEEHGRKKRSTAGAGHWNPDTGRVVVYFEKIDSAAPMADTDTTPRSLPLSLQQPSAHSELNAAAVTPLQIQQCCNALADSEKAGKSFISLKWFRDEALTQHRYDWTVNADDRQKVLAKAIEEGAIKTERIQNPKNPQFPTTTVKLNRTVPHPGVTSRFNPVPVRGEPVSHTIMRDRGSL